jgi:hypothetical protein
MCSDKSHDDFFNLERRRERRERLEQLEQLGRRDSPSSILECDLTLKALTYIKHSLMAAWLSSLDQTFTSPACYVQRVSTTLEAVHGQDVYRCDVYATRPARDDNGRNAITRGGGVVTISMSVYHRKLSSADTLQTLQSVVNRLELPGRESLAEINRKDVEDCRTSPLWSCRVPDGYCETRFRSTCVQEILGAKVLVLDMVSVIDCGDFVVGVPFHRDVARSLNGMFKCDASRHVKIRRHGRHLRVAFEHLVQIEMMNERAIL